jgi:hypothetical protein
MDDTMCVGVVFSGGSRGMCPLACVSDALGVNHLIAQFGSFLTSTWLLLGLI